MLNSSTSFTDSKSLFLFPSPWPSPSPLVYCNSPQLVSLSLVHFHAKALHNLHIAYFNLKLLFATHFAPGTLASLLSLKLPLCSVPQDWCTHSSLDLECPPFLQGCCEGQMLRCVAEVKGVLGTLSLDIPTQGDFPRSFKASLHPYERAHGRKAGSMLCFN